jgi:ABC transporter substrate binding protein
MQVVYWVTCLTSKLFSANAPVTSTRILKGAKPSDPPVQEPTKIDLIVNLKIAKPLGITIPPSILARADEVIEWTLYFRLWPIAT